MENDSTYKLVLHPSPVLKQKLTEEVHHITEEHKAIAEKMLRTMYASKGCGLSTPQVGLNIRLIVYDAGNGPKVMFNPFITNRLPKKERSGEGCLSFPKLRVITQRFTTISVRYRDLESIVREEQFSDFEARIIQHEIDHLEGITFMQRK
jgi:peptide deformylase